MSDRESLTELSYHLSHNHSQSRDQKHSRHPASLKQCCKNEEEEDPIHATPSTQNAGVDESLISQEILKKKCIGCIDFEKKLLEVEQELRSERKKNLRYLKIINSKMKKEKELQMAYGQIAQELKRRMDAANAREINHQQNSFNYNRQAEQLRALRIQLHLVQRNLTDTTEKLRSAQQRYENLLGTIQQNRQKDCPPKLQSQQQILNVFYEKQLVELHQKINGLESQLKLREDELKSEKLLYLNRIQKAKEQALKEAAEKSSNSILQAGNQQRTSNKSKHSEQIVPQHSSHCKREDEEVEALKPFNMSKISSIEARNDHSDLDDIIQEFQREQSFNTVTEWVSSQFHSIHHSHSYHLQPNSLPSFLKSRLSEKQRQFQSIEQYSDSQFFSIASELFQNDISKISRQNSSKNIAPPSKLIKHLSLEQAQKQENEESNKMKKIAQEEDIVYKQELEQMRTQRQAAFRFTETVAAMLQKFGITLASAGQKYKLSLQMPQLPRISCTEAAVSYQTRIEELILFSSTVEQAGHRFQQHFHMILKLMKKQYERQLNNQELQMADLKTRISQEDEQKRHLGRIVSKLQEHNTRLEYKISEVEETPISSSNSIRESYLRSVIKKKSSMYQNRFIEESTQCEILPSNTQEIRAAQLENYEKMLEAVEYLPKFLNKILEKHKVQACLSIDVQKDLFPQFQEIIKKSINLLHIHISNEQEIPSPTKRLRRCSFNTKQIIPLDEKNTRTQNLLESENTRLRDCLKQKTEKMMALSEKNTLLSAEKTRLQDQLKEVQCRFSEEVKSLKLSLTESKASEFFITTGQKPTERLDSIKENDSQSGEFAEYEEKIEFNNLYWDKDEQLKSLMLKNEIYQQKLQKYKMQVRKRRKKVIYINN